MKTFGEFQEAAAAIKALPTIVKAFTKVAPMVAPKLKTFAKFSTAVPVGLSVLQARKYKTRNNPTGRVGIEKKGKRNISDMEKTLDDKRSDGMIVAKPGEVQKQNKLIDKYEKIQKSTENNLKRKNFIKRLRGDIPEETMAAPTNSVGGGQIAGTVEAGDDPPKKKKKKKTYAYGGRGSRKMWMANKYTGSKNT